MSILYGTRSRAASALSSTEHGRLWEAQVSY